jgi:hypothetical protein
MVRLLRACVVIGLVILPACSFDQNAKDAATEILGLQKAHKHKELWQRISYESRGKLSDQLQKVKQSNPASNFRKNVTSVFAIPESKVDSLTVEEYFDYIMKEMDKNATIPDIVNVEESGKTANIYFKNVKSEGVDYLKRENGKWMLMVKVY